MRVTRSSTNSLPSSNRPAKKRKTKQQQHDEPPPDDSGPTIGDADRFSKLPYEILVMIWSYCEPVDLLHLCRTSRALRLYLTTKSAESVWIASRERMSVVAQRHWHLYDGYYDEFEDHNYEPYDDQPWPRTYPIPTPPPYLNEIAWASFLFVDKCQHCQTGAWAIKRYGTYQSACGPCTDAKETNIYRMKREHENKDVDLRYYSILPHYKSKNSFFRNFWKPTCDMLLREMVEFELSVGLKESAIKEWIIEKRKIIADHGEGKELEVKVKVWRSADNHCRKLGLDDRRERNIAMFLHYMKDKDYHADDLTDFCRLNPHASWLNTDAIIFDTDAARKALTDQADKLKQIRIFREEYEAAEKLKPATERISGYIKASIEKLALESTIPWRFNYKAHMPDVLSLPAVEPVLESIRDEDDATTTVELWNSKWVEFCDQMVEMEDEWLDMLLLLVVGEKRAGNFHARDHIKPVTTVFGCDKCSSKGVGTMYYPAVLDHPCFCKTVASPQFSRLEPTYYSKRSVPLNLSLIFYDADSSRKLSSIVDAVEQAGQIVPGSVSSFYTLTGLFTCKDCPEDARLSMSWAGAKNHICETTYYREMQEDGEMEMKSRRHKRLEYIVPQTEEEAN